MNPCVRLLVGRSVGGLVGLLVCRSVVISQGRKLHFRAPFGALVSSFFQFLIHLRRLSIIVMDVTCTNGMVKL